MNTESLEISVLVKVRGLAAILGYGSFGILQDGPVFEIEGGKDARCVPAVVDLNQSNDR